MKYRLNVGLNYTPPGGNQEKRAEAGALVDDLPEGSVGWLLAERLIEPAGRAAAVEPLEENVS